MSSKNKDTNSTSDKTKEYRINKKINKSKIRSGQKSKNSLIYPEEDFNINELPSGAFDRNNTLNNNDKKEDFNKIDSEKPENEIDKEKIHKIHKILMEEDEEYEYDDFNDNYFDPVPYIKK
jgi:hypothetical protein